jgi:hypothetical protein
VRHQSLDRLGKGLDTGGTEGTDSSRVVVGDQVGNVVAHRGVAAGDGGFLPVTETVLTAGLGQVLLSGPVPGRQPVVETTDFAERTVDRIRRQSHRQEPGPKRPR